jgi:UDP-N-acetylglucosamine:LPS N-acetylglucosamine transferase
LSEGRPPKILIFTSHTGGGHISLAEALRDRLSDRYTVEFSDPQPRFVHWHYRLVSRHALWLWAAEFRLADTPARSRLSHGGYALLLSRYVAGVLRSVRPDLVISTYPFLTSEVTFAMRWSGRRVPFIMLFADPNGVHQSWLTEKKADAVFAPTRETYRQALEAGFDPQQLHLTGWPVRAQFYRDSLPAPDERLAEMGLNPLRFTIFLQGGGDGAAKFIQTVENILAVPNLQIILATGTNRALFERFQNVPRLFALPFTKHIAAYMNAADVVMGKAGPNMLFESVTLGKPFIATAYIPGQEEANLEFIRRYGLGWVALDAPAQSRLAADLVANPGHLRAMQESVQHYRSWNREHNHLIETAIRQLLKEDNHE